MALACDYVNSKLVDVVTVADEDQVGNSLLQIRKLRSITNYLMDFFVKGGGVPPNSANFLGQKMIFPLNLSLVLKT